MYDHTFSKLANHQATHKSWLLARCSGIWVGTYGFNILTLSPPKRAGRENLSCLAKGAP